MTYRVTGIGELLWDHFPSGKKLGGAPANVAYHISALGGKGFIVSGIGNDKSGRDILEKLDKLGVNRQYVTIHPRYPTGKAWVEIDPDGIPSFRISENASWDGIRMTPGLQQLAWQVDAIVFGTLAQRSQMSRNTIREFINSSRPESFCILDLNLRTPYYSEEVIYWSLNSCDILKLNQEELSICADLLEIKGDIHELLDQILGCFPIKLIALTLGNNGSLIHSKDAQCRHTGNPVSIVDTVGAGDAYTAALTLGLLEGLSLEMISDYANRVASYVCSQTGATPLMPGELHISNYIIPPLQLNNSGKGAKCPE